MFCVYSNTGQYEVSICPINGVYKNLKFVLIMLKQYIDHDELMENLLIMYIDIIV